MMAMMSWGGVGRVRVRVRWKADMLVRLDLLDPGDIRCM